MNTTNDINNITIKQEREPLPLSQARFYQLFKTVQNQEYSQMTMRMKQELSEYIEISGYDKPEELAECMFYSIRNGYGLQYIAQMIYKTTEKTCNELDEILFYGK